MAVKGEGFVETTKACIKDSSRVYFVNPKGLVMDLPPTNTPPLITGIAKDGLRLLVDQLGQGPLDIQATVIGLTAQSVAALKGIFV